MKTLAKLKSDPRLELCKPLKDGGYLVKRTDGARKVVGSIVKAQNYLREIPYPDDPRMQAVEARNPAFLTMPERTVTKPGTPERIECYRQRIENGEHLWHPHDRDWL